MLRCSETSALADHRQQVALANLLAQVGLDFLHDAVHARGDVGGTVFVQLNLARQAHERFQARRSGGTHLDVGCRDLRIGEGNGFVVGGTRHWSGMLIAMRFGRFSHRSAHALHPSTPPANRTAAATMAAMVIF